MKDLSALSVPEDLRYTDEHEWARPGDGAVRVGITDFAQDQLGDVVYVELPEIGAAFEAGQEFGTVESVKAVSELYMPVGGEVTAVNDTLDGAPQLVNDDPYGEGWMVEVRPSDPTAIDTLLTADAYRAHLGKEAG